MKTLRIGEVAELTRTPASTLRYYEQIGVLPEPRREGGRRRYDERVVALVAAVKLAIRCGFTLAEIRAARVDGGGGLPPEWLRLVGGKLRENEEEQGRLRGAHDLLEAFTSCPCTDLTECELLRAV